MENVKQFLEQTQTAVEKQRKIQAEQAKISAPDFRLYEFMYQNENSISKYIQTLLDVKGKHGQGGLYMDLFVKEVLPPAYSRIDKSHIQNSKVVLEKITDTGRFIDIYIDLGAYGVIGIENKPWANDQENQLKDYADYLLKSSDSDKWLLVYLCNSEPSEYSIDSETRKHYEKSGKLLTIGFDKIVGWLSKCAENTEPRNIVVFIESLQQLIDEKVNGNLKNVDCGEIKNLIKNTNSGVELAFSVTRGVHDLKFDLLNKFKARLSSELSKENMCLLWGIGNDLSRKGGFQINLTSNSNGLFYLAFEFVGYNLNGLSWGLRYNASSSVNDNNNNIISKIMREKFGNGEAPQYWWPWWEWVGDGEHLKNFGSWELNHSPWLAMDNGAMAEEILKLAIEIKNLFSGTNFLGSPI